VSTLTRTTFTPVGSTFQGTSAGQAAGWQNAGAGGDLIPISSGRGTVLRFRTTAAGTAITVTLDSVVQTAYGTDVNPAISLATTDEQEVFIPNDGVGRFDQQPTNTGYLSVTYTGTFSGSQLQIAAKTVP
jgi:hypothetical protein